MAFNAGEKGAIVKTDTAYINISSDGFNKSIPVGAIEYEGDEGTRIAYQAGGVFRETGSETQVVSVPPINYNERNSTVSFPIIELSEENDISSGDISITRINTTPHPEMTYVEQSTIKMNITSEYCVGWENYFKRQTEKSQGQAIRESCSEGDDDTVRVELGRMDLPKGTFEDGIVANDVSGDDDDMDITEKEDYSPPVVDDIVDQMITDMDPDKNENVTSIENVSGSTATSGTYFTENKTLTNDLTFNLSDGNATLVVKGDLDIDGSTFSVKNWEQPDQNHTLQIYVEEGLHIDGGGSKMCVDPCTSGNIDPEYLQVYGKSDAHLAIGTGDSSFEGLIYAPSEEPFSPENRYINKNGQLVTQSNADIYGSIITSSAHIQSNAPKGMYDPSLKNFNPQMNPQGYVFPPHLSYLHITEHTIEVKNN
ncbi:hypothetical protein E2L06_12560 [Haloterrigena sp. H1]|uniref:DUF7289 family protein n=1 Tax=Haloterrigena sp. H1 TaxID=2552943 RepID=UPI00110E4438|nr:hypothetical protein [Haloterrigena sp. H1]TMT87368.1 hypothetical protein E2L06_12560 [Haloterrigena sp. H1]